MATNQEVLRVLAGKTGPATPTEVAKDLGVKASEVTTPLQRLTEKTPPLATVNDDSEYTITDAGKKEINPVTEQDAGITENQVFIKYGLRIGVPRDVVELTQEHVWAGGNFRDLKWVMQGMIEQNIKKDMRERWWSLWRSYLGQAIPSELVKDLGSKEDKDTLVALGAGVEKITDSKDATKGGTRLRDYIIDASGNPLYVGAENGDLEYLDAVRITTIRAATSARIPVAGVDSGGAGKGDRITDATALLKALQELGGGNGKGKTMLVIQNETGGFQLQEVEPGSTVAVPHTTGGVNTTVPKGYYIGDDDDMHEIEPGKPIIIKRAPSGGGDKPPPAPRVFFIENGEVKEYDPGKPFIVHQAPQNQSSGMMLSIPTADGKSSPISVNDLEKWLDTTFKIQDHNTKVSRDQERHDVQMDLMKTFKKFATKGVRAFGNTSEEDTDEEDE